MQHLHGTREMMLSLELNVHPNFWVDSLYAVHPDMCCHSGIFMQLKKGTTYSTSCNQKLKEKISAEAELVG